MACLPAWLLCPRGETAITVPIDGRHNARGLDSAEFSTAQRTINLPAVLQAGVGGTGQAPPRSRSEEEQICRDRKAVIGLIRLMSGCPTVGWLDRAIGRTGGQGTISEMRGDWAGWLADHGIV